MFSEEIRENPGQFIRHDIIDKVLLRDLPSLYGISDVQELNSLFTMIAYHSGAQFSYEKLSKESGVKKETLKKYIMYAEQMIQLNTINEKHNSKSILLIHHLGVRCSNLSASKTMKLEIWLKPQFMPNGFQDKVYQFVTLTGK